MFKIQSFPYQALETHRASHTKPACHYAKRRTALSKYVILMNVEDLGVGVRGSLVKQGGSGTQREQSGVSTKPLFAPSVTT